jgi:nitrogen fixation protein FixH
MHLASDVAACRYPDAIAKPSRQCRRIKISGMNRSLVLLLSVVLLFEVAGCRSKSNPETLSQSVASSNVDSAVSPWKIDLRVTPQHPSMIKPLTLTVHIVDGKGRTVDNAQVRGSLAMKVMDMGKNELQLQPKGHGDYEAAVKELDMSGPWDFAVDASQDGFHAQKKFEITIYD